MPEFPGVERGIGIERSLRRKAGRFGRTGEMHIRSTGKGNMCKCPKCGYEEPKIPDVRCEQIHCPKCGMPMGGR